MADPPKQAPTNPPQAPPQKQNAAVKSAPAASHSGVLTSAEVAANMPNFTVGELVDLALCSPEIGAVNFNILRLLLRDIILKTGIDKSSVKMNDLDAHQVENFKNYVQGASVPSPMPGVLKIAPQGKGAGAQGMVYGAQRGPDGQKGESKTPRAPKPGLPPGGGPREGDLPERITRLEKDFDSLYQLPENKELLEKAKTDMSVNDMWQIIQLNNRIAAAEAAIQKMASLIEDLARSMNRVKGDTKTMKKDTDDLALTHSDLQIQGQNLTDKYDKFKDIIKGLRDDVEKLKKGWKKDRDLMEKTLGVDLGKVPSFMKMKGTSEAGTGGGLQEEPSEGTLALERGTQTFVYLKDQENMAPPQSPPKQAHKRGPGSPQGHDQDAGGGQRQSSGAPHSPKSQNQQQRHAKPKPAEAMIPPEKIAQMTPEDMLKEVTPEEVAQIPPEVFKKMTPQQRKTLRDIYQTAPPRPPVQKKSLGVRNMTPEEIGKLEPDKIVDKMPYEEASKLTPQDLAKMSDKQKQAIQKVIDKGPAVKQPAKAKPMPPKQQPKKPPLGLAAMNEDQLAATSPTTISDKMAYEEAANIPPDVLNKMTDEQRKAIKKVVDAGPPPPVAEGALPAGDEDYDAYDQDEDEDFMAFLEESQNSQMQYATEGKRPSIKEGGGGGKRPSKGAEDGRRLSKEKRKTPPKLLTADELKDISKISPEELASKLSPETAAAIPEEELQRRFTPAQIQEIQRLKSIAPPQGGGKDFDEQEPTVNLDEVSPDQLAQISPSELASNLTDNQLLKMTEEQMNKFTPDQQVAVKDAIRKSRIRHAEGVEEEWDEEEGEEEGLHTDAEEMYDFDDTDELGRGRKSGNKEKPQRPKPQHRHHKHHHHHHHDHHGTEAVPHPHVDVIQGPIPTVGEALPPMSLEAYMASLPADQAANMAADAVQRELQKQYAQLQGMQRQLAQDIQDKMEFIYQKLLQEITTQQLTTSPYMAVGGTEVCLGPGICTGHGMPAGVAVVQFPEVQDKDKMRALIPTGAAIQGPMDTTGKVCPGPAVCPGSAVCPYCQGQLVGLPPAPPGSAQEALQALRAPGMKGGESPRGVTLGQPLSELDEAVLKEIKSLMLLDLEKIREEMRSKKLGAFDEQDIVERLGAVWEALKILKHNEESLAIKIARQDEMLRKLPLKLLEKLNKIPEENLDAIATGQFHDGLQGKRGTQREMDMDLPKPSFSKPMSSVDKEDIQTLFNNLANVIAECAEQKERLDQLSDTTRIMESGMVTKQMLLDALSDKADKGLINTKVSYDEFGNTVDELHNQLHNLMVEGYQRNENWKKTTAGLAEELTEKLDKVEIAPIRAFFKSHLKALEEKVNVLSKIVEEPDPAGTRKRLLRDYNCLSCDRMVNITGVTNGPTLPKIGPISAGHTTASQRALELHRMRMRKQFDPDTKNLNALGRQTKALKSAKNIHVDPKRIACDIDVMHVVNRYTGGSHTAISTGERIASQRRPSTVANPPPMVSGGTVPNTAPIATGGGET